MSNDAMKFLSENAWDPDKPKLPGLSWKNRPDGFTVVGTIVDAPTVAEVPDLDNPTGPKVKKLVLNLKLTEPISYTEKVTDERGFMSQVEKQADTFALFVTRGGLANEIDKACKKGGGDLAKDGKLAIKLAGRKDVGKPSPMNVFEVAYEPPAASVNLASMFGTAGS